MNKKISIDELVRQKVANGEEPHNLGAWANMERMLDGKNPYHQDKDDKKPFWMFLLLGFLVVGTSIIAGYSYLKKDNHLSQNSADIIPTKGTSANINTQKILDQNNESPTEGALAVASANNNDIIEQIEKTESNKLQQKLTDPTKLSSPLLASQAASINQPNVNKSAITASALPNKLNSNAIKKPTTTFPTVSSERKNLKPSDLYTLDNKKNQVNTEKIEPTITESYLDTTKITEVSQHVVKDQSGNKKIITDSFSYALVQEKKRTVINPRFVALNEEQEMAAQRKTALASNEKIAESAQARIDIHEPVSQTPNTANSKSAKVSTKERSGFFTLFKNISEGINQKAIQITHTKFPIHTGMFVGLNAALVNSKHNFGGFQGGFTAMTPLSRLLTLQMEARFIHKNNSGYTIKDNRNVVRSTFIDTTSVFKSKIYNYEIDSVNYGYNLNNFYTLQIPLLLNADFQKINVYAGMHFDYGFRMNIITSSRSNSLTASDTVGASETYIPRNNTDTRLTRNDFGRRFGLGYTVGGAYQFNDKLSLDLRMSNLFWDNTSGVAKKEITNVFFRIPSFQLSVAYRFRGYEKTP